MGFIGNIFGAGTRAAKKSLSKAEEELNNIHRGVGKKSLSGASVDKGAAEAASAAQKKIDEAKKAYSKAKLERARDTGIAAVPTVGTAALYVSNKRMDKNLRET
jgi:hypothetical protein